MAFVLREESIADLPITQVKGIGRKRKLYFLRGDVGSASDKWQPTTALPGMASIEGILYESTGRVQSGTSTIAFGTTDIVFWNTGSAEICAIIGMSDTPTA